MSDPQTTNTQAKLLCKKLLDAGGAGDAFGINRWKFEPFEADGLITIHKVRCGPLALADGTIELRLTDKGSELANAGV